MLPLISAIQRHVAVASTGPSTVRGQGPGVSVAAREFLAVLPLRSFSAATEAYFRSSLDEATNDLVNSLPASARSWGLARKCLNIFLRNSFYNAHLASEYDLQASESFYEIPLDRIVARELRKRAGRNRLPRWPGVKHLEFSVSESYQTYAFELARAWNIRRVYLDTYLWVEGRENS
jgi:hypothetical protein